MAGARRIAFTQAVHVQRARATRNPDALAPAELQDLDRYGKPWLRKVAAAEVASLVAALAATQDDPDNPGRDRALACYDAAALQSTERDGRLDLFGVIVLAREGHAAVADRDPLPLPVCQVHRGTDPRCAVLAAASASASFPLCAPSAGGALPPNAADGPCWWMASPTT